MTRHIPMTQLVAMVLLLSLSRVCNGAEDPCALGLLNAREWTSVHHHSEAWYSFLEHVARFEETDENLRGKIVYKGAPIDGAWARKKLEEAGRSVSEQWSRSESETRLTSTVNPEVARDWLKCIELTHSMRSDEPVVVVIQSPGAGRVFDVEVRWRPNRAIVDPSGPSLSDVVASYTLEPVGEDEDVEKKDVNLGTLADSGEDSFQVIRPSRNWHVHGIVSGTVVGDGKKLTVNTHFFIPADPIVEQPKPPTFVTRGMVTGSFDLIDWRIDRTYDEPARGRRGETHTRWASVPEYVFSRGITMHPEAPQHGLKPRVVVSVPAGARYFSAQFMLAGVRCGPHFGNVDGAVDIVYPGGSVRTHRIGNLNSVNSKNVLVNVMGADRIELIVDPLDSNHCDKAAWAEAQFLH